MTKTYWEMEVKLHMYLTSALHGSEIHTLSYFVYNDRSPDSHWTRNQMGPRGGQMLWLARS
jgi:hypothetical protein